MACSLLRASTAFRRQALLSAALRHTLAPSSSQPSVAALPAPLPRPIPSHATQAPRHPWCAPAPVSAAPYPRRLARRLHPPRAPLIDGGRHSRRRRPPPRKRMHPKARTNSAWCSPFASTPAERRRRGIFQGSSLQDSGRPWPVDRRGTSTSLCTTAAVQRTWIAAGGSAWWED
jgi:hypothetical protein